MLKDIKGLRYPDDYVIKYFFKMGFDRRVGSVLELGCGNGNNLMLFHQFGWNVTGLDISKDAVTQARGNFSGNAESNASHSFWEHDLGAGLPDSIKGKFDAILMPNVLYYIPREAAQSVLSDLRPHARPGTFVFTRNRSLRDYRYGRGKKAGRNAFRLDCAETGELGLLNVFYHEHELIEMLLSRLELDPATLNVLRVEYQNNQNDMVVSNSDMVIWGQVRS